MPLTPGPLLEAYTNNREHFLPRPPTGGGLKLGLNVRNVPSVPKHVPGSRGGAL